MKNALLRIGPGMYVEVRPRKILSRAVVTIYRLSERDIKIIKPIILTSLPIGIGATLESGSNKVPPDPTE